MYDNTSGMSRQECIYANKLYAVYVPTVGEYNKQAGFSLLCCRMYERWENVIVDFFCMTVYLRCGEMPPTPTISAIRSSLSVFVYVCIFPLFATTTAAPVTVTAVVVVVVVSGGHQIQSAADFLPSHEPRCLYKNVSIYTTRGGLVPGIYFCIVFILYHTVSCVRVRLEHTLGS